MLDKRATVPSVTRGRPKGVANSVMEAVVLVVYGGVVESSH